MHALSDLAVTQIKIFVVMAAAGILVETIRQIKEYVNYKFKEANLKRATEAVFWTITIIIISKFLYYCAFGKLSLLSIAGFFIGLLLYRKTCCDIIKEVWVEKEEAENLKTTARSSILRRPENKGWKKDGQKRKKKKKK